jgi:hypothetical protein
MSHEGYEVMRSGGAKADWEVDLVAEKAGAKAIVQCKHWQNWRVLEAPPLPASVSRYAPFVVPTSSQLWHHLRHRLRAD